MFGKKNYIFELINFIFKKNDDDKNSENIIPY